MKLVLSKLSHYMDDRIKSKNEKPPMKITFKVKFLSFKKQGSIVPTPGLKQADPKTQLLFGVMRVEVRS